MYLLWWFTFINRIFLYYCWLLLGFINRAKYFQLFQVSGRSIDVVGRTKIRRVKVSYRLNKTSALTHEAYRDKMVFVHVQEIVWLYDDWDVTDLHWMSHHLHSSSQNILWITVYTFYIKRKNPKILILIVLKTILLHFAWVISVTLTFRPCYIFIGKAIIHIVVVFNIIMANDNTIIIMIMYNNIKITIIIAMIVQRQW